MSPAAKAWAVLAAWVIGWDLLSTEGQTLSEGVDRWIERNPATTRLAIAIVALHLGNALPAQADPLHLALVAARKVWRCTRR